MKLTGAGCLVAALSTATLTPSAFAVHTIPGVPGLSSTNSPSSPTSNPTPFRDVNISETTVDASTGDATVQITVTVPEDADVAELDGAIQNGRGAYGLEFIREDNLFTAQFTPSRSSPDGKWTITYLQARDSDGAEFDPAYGNFASVTVTGSAHGHQGRLLRAATLSPVPYTNAGDIQSYIVRIVPALTIDPTNVTAYITVDGATQLVEFHPVSPGSDYWTTTIPVEANATVDLSQIEYVTSDDNSTWFTPLAELGYLVSRGPN